MSEGLKFHNRHAWYLFSLIVAILFFVDPVSHIVNRKLVILITDVFLFFAVFLTIVFRYKISDKRGILALTFLALAIAISMIYLIEGGISGLLTVKTVGILMVVLLFSFLFKFENNFSILYKTVGYLLLGVLLFIIIEYYMQIYMGYLPVFEQMWGESGYRSDERLLLYFPYVINGPIFGAQTVGILSLMALFYVIYSYRGLLRFILFVVSLVCLYWSFKITAVLCLVVALFTVSYTYTKKSWKLARILAMILLLSLPFTLYYLILFKANFDPISISVDIYSTPAISQLFSIINVLWKFPFGTSLVDEYIEVADISILTLLLRFGFIFLLLFIIISISAIIKLIRYAKKMNDDCIRVIISYLTILLVSSIHYPTLITPGIFHIYIVFLSLGIVSKKLLTLRLLSGDKNLTS